MKKIGAYIVIAVLALTLLSGCGSERVNDNDGVVTPTPRVTAQVTPQVSNTPQISDSGTNQTDAPDSGLTGDTGGMDNGTDGESASPIPTSANP